MNLDLDPTNIFISIVFGLIGVVYTAYGKKNNFYFLLAGLGLIVYTFFDLDTFTMVWIGLALMIAPFILTKLDL
jgi:hypothetical protein